MIGLDTNILVRYFAQDEPTQSALATEWIERKLSATNPGFVSVATVVETVWVLARIYGMDGAGIARVLEAMLGADTLVIQHEQEVFWAMAAVKEGKATFADALIAALGKSAGCSTNITFDNRAVKLEGFQRLVAADA